MKIRRIILISCALLVFAIALPLMTVLYFSSKDSIEQEISRNINNDAIMLMEEVDMMLFERMQNVQLWSRLDIIQEARISDVDKRLSDFLADVATGYKGMYQHLFYVNTEQKILAASSADWIGRVYNKTENELKVEVTNGDVFVENVLLSVDPDSMAIAIRAPVNDSYSFNLIGQLYGLFDMRHVFRMLDKASITNSGQRYVVLLNANGKAIAASANLRYSDALSKIDFADWKPTHPSVLFVHQGQPITDSPVLVGYAASSSYLGFVQMGWSVLIFQSTAEAFLPIQSLLLSFAIIIVLTVFLLMLASHWLSGYIAKPLSNLSVWVRELSQTEKLSPPKVEGAIEVRELTDAFWEMFQALAQSREQLIQTAKLAVIGEMSATMAHEIRTPVGIISTSAQLLLREQHLSTDGKEMSLMILDESTRLKKLVNTLLECARPRAPFMQLVNIHELIKHVTDLLAVQAANKQITLSQELHAENPVIPCDSDLLTQVFLNLILNAIQIVPDLGFIEIRSSLLRDQMQIEIADNGPGIQPEDYKKLFEPFFSKRQGGIGLGLSVTRQIIIAHHGKISVGASLWGGACFTLHLPVKMDESC